MDYFYDQQIRKYILQVTAMFGGFIVKTGRGRNGTIQDRQCPVRYGETSRMVNHIIRLNSENTVLYTPFMSTHITSINMAPDRRQAPSLVTTHQINERQFDEETGEYNTEIGNEYTVKRYMPVPYNFTFQLDIWASNINEKQQLMEQIMMLFNPAVDFQTSDSPLDWTAITYAEMQDNIVWTGRSVPLGTDEQIDVASMQFLVPGWISPPAEVTQRKVIQTIINNIYAVKDLPDNEPLTFEEDGALLTEIIITPGNHIIRVDGDEIILLSDAGNVNSEETGEPFSWKKLIESYGNYEEGETIINVKQKFGDATGITGTFTFDETRENIIFWEPNPDDLYMDTLSPINAVIDPMVNYPGDGILPPAATGQRYLIAEDIPETSNAWGNVVGAMVNDIIEYDGATWNVTFDSETDANTQIVTSQATNKQLRWGGEEWAPTVDREYLPGAWRIQL